MTRSDGVDVQFKRHRPPLTLYGTQADVFVGITDAGPTPVDALPAASVAIVRTLVEQRALGVFHDAA